MAKTRRVVIVGGGVTGLAAAHELSARASRAGIRIAITLLERGQRLGGNIVTTERDGFTLDGGPDSWVATKPYATALARSLGLGHDLVPTIEATRKVYVAFNGELHPIPEGLVLAVPTKIMPVLKSRLFSFGAKARMGLEPFVRTKTFQGEEDESVADFVTRRLGAEVTERLAAPLLGGIFAGDAASLSIRATFPQFVEMEQKHGSLVRAMRAAKRANASPGGKAPSAFLSLRGGLGGLIRALSSGLGDTDVRTGARVTAVSRLEAGDERGRYAVEVESQDTVFADHVMIGAPAHAVASVLRSLDSRIAADLETIRYASTATLFLAFRREDVKHPLDGVGFIVPRALKRPILAATWVSSKWEGRAPQGRVLMRVFFGGAWGEDILANEDEGLARIARGELRDMMGLDAEPLFTQAFRFDRSNPQPAVGHLSTMARIRERLVDAPGIHIAGSGYDGVGIPDCVRQAHEIVGAILAGT